jgi:hypothetical protein
MGKLTPKMRRLLTWLEGGSKLESQIVGSGLSETLNKALRLSYVDMGASETVRDGKAPAAEVYLTGNGRAALKENV